MGAVWRACGAWQGPRGGAGIIRGEERFTFPPLPVTLPRFCSSRPLPERAPDPWRLGSTRPAMACARIAVSAAGQLRGG